MRAKRTDEPEPMSAADVAEAIAQLENQPDVKQARARLDELTQQLAATEGRIGDLEQAEAEARARAVNAQAEALLNGKSATAVADPPESAKLTNLRGELPALRKAIELQEGRVKALVAQHREALADRIETQYREQGSRLRRALVKAMRLNRWLIDVRYEAVELNRFGQYPPNLPAVGREWIGRPTAGAGQPWPNARGEYFLADLLEAGFGE